MQRFDCLSLDCPLFGPHLLEASAGTGKTFSIEHIYVRLILESKDIEVEQILAVTFTRAATRELKARIRSNLENALSMIQSGEATWEYLKPHLGSEDASRLLSDAISAFDRCQIFTIHGFCYRMLREFAFEAKIGFSLPDPDGGRGTSQKISQAARDFLEWGIKEEDLCPEQAALLIQKYPNLEKIEEKLLLREKKEGPRFSELFNQYKKGLEGWQGNPIEELKLLQDFHSLENGFKKAEAKGDLEGQVIALAKSFQTPDDPRYFRTLIREKGSLFAFLDPLNRKVKFSPPAFLNYPGFFDWARLQFGSLFEQKSSQVLQTLQGLWSPIAERILSEEEQFNPDEILVQMRKAIEREEFASRVRQKYRAAIIDEFQDTDAMQWEIFRSLFLDSSSSLRALYLVGDPKQSIYRFRNADVYTYLEARDFLGEQHLYHLDTNFRSSKKLIGALNAIFQRDWLVLPKANRVLPYLPVKAGASITSEFPDEKGSLHFLIAEGENLFDEAFLPFAVQEIEKLGLKEFSKFAVLVKDRYQVEKALELFREREIPAIARSHICLGDTLAFQAIRELFEAVIKPRDFSAAKIVMAGPFGEIPFAEFKLLLEEKGLVFFGRAFFDNQMERMAAYDLSFTRDVLQIFELLFLWEKREGFSFEGLTRYLNVLKTLKADEGGRRRMDCEENAVQVMTLHISKGLEFEVVFALGLSTRTPENEEEAEELDAEKLRQLYVAMTRAKKRLYVPLAMSEKEGKSGTHSPMELFCRHLEKEGPLMERISALSQQENITFEKLQLPIVLPDKIRSPEKKITEQKSFYRPTFTPSLLSSFTSLAKSKERDNKIQAPSSDFTIHTIPRGTETGIFIHQIFERLFSSSKPIWRDPSAIETMIADELRFSPLEPWKESIQKKVCEILRLPLQIEGEFFSLSELESENLKAEMEFVFAAPPHFVKGFIDLVFFHRGKMFFVDWKTNWLGENDAAYNTCSLEKAMKDHDYGLQAAIYAEALGRQYAPIEIGGAFYLFLRGCAPFYFQPELKLLRECYAKPTFD